MSTVSTSSTGTPPLSGSPVPASPVPANPSDGAPAQSFSDVLNSMPNSAPTLAAPVASTAPAPVAPQTNGQSAKSFNSTAAAASNTTANETASSTRSDYVEPNDISTLPDSAANGTDLAALPAASTVSPDEDNANLQASVPVNSNGRITLSAADARAANAKILRALALTNAPAPLLINPLAVASDSNAQSAPVTAAVPQDNSKNSDDDAQAATDSPSTSEQVQAQPVAVPPPMQVCIPPIPAPVQASFTPTTNTNTDGESDAASGERTPITASSTFNASTQPTRIMVNAATVRDRYAQTDSTPHSSDAAAPDQAASTQLDPLRNLLDTMTPVDAAPVAPASDTTLYSQNDAASIVPADTFTIRTTTTATAGQSTKAGAKSSTVENASNSTVVAHSNTLASAPSIIQTAAQSAALSNDTVSTSNASAAAATIAAVSTDTQNARGTSETGSNFPKNSAQPASFSNDQFNVAAPVAPALSAGSTDANANNADTAFGHDRQASSASQLDSDAPASGPAANGSKAETFAANAFSAVAPGGYWTEKTPDAAPAKTSEVFNQVLDVLPKPLQATTITIKPEGYGAITIRVTPQPLDTASPWRISIRTSDASAHALLSQNVAELRQNLKGDPAHVFGSLKPALQASATQETPMRQDSQNSKGGQRQDFEQRQRNRSRGFVFELPELDA